MALKLLTHAEQVAAHLRGELLAGRWLGEMPGEAWIGRELGVNHTTVGAALRLLEAEGLLLPQGGGRRRQIVLPKHEVVSGLRVGLLLHAPADTMESEVIAVRYRLAEAGHIVNTASKTQTDPGMNASRVARVVGKTEADAWVVLGASSEILRWFSEQSTPAIAYAGQYPPDMRLACVSPQRERAIQALVRRLVSLGHHRIVLLTGSGAKPRAFLEELEAQGIRTGPYNVPDWKYSPEGFRRCLDALFATTPPTAVVIDEALLFLVAERHLARRGIIAPEHVSLICTDPDPAFEWCDPSIAHIRWDKDHVVRRIVRWVANISRGMDDRRQTFIASEFVDGGSVGPAPK